MSEHPRGKAYSNSTYNRYKCRCAGCTEAARLYNKARRSRASESVETVAQELWIDWSGISAVVVCKCGWQEFGGFDLIDARALAIAHRDATHPEWPRIYIPHTALPCAWGGTEWAVLWGEDCESPAVNNGLCAKHNMRARQFEERGMCSVPMCLKMNRAGEDVCSDHFYRRRTLGPVAVAKPGKARMEKAPIRLPEGMAHGVRAGYKRGCRCVHCGAAQSLYASAARKARLEGGSI